MELPSNFRFRCRYRCLCFQSSLLLASCVVPVDLQLWWLNSSKVKLCDNYVWLIHLSVFTSMFILGRLVGSWARTSPCYILHIVNNEMLRVPEFLLLVSWGTANRDNLSVLHIVMMWCVRGSKQFLCTHRRYNILSMEIQMWNPSEIRINLLFCQLPCTRLNIDWWLNHNFMNSPSSEWVT